MCYSAGRWAPLQALALAVSPSIGLWGQDARGNVPPFAEGTLPPLLGGNVLIIVNCS